MNGNLSLAFLSNKITSHQIPLSDELYKHLGGNYHFIETMKIDNDSLPIGWKNSETPPYLITNKYYCENSGSVQALIDSCDIAVYGAAPFELVKNRLMQGKVVFRYSERILKKKENFFKILLRKQKYKSKYEDYSNHFLLCAGAYVFADYSLMGLFENKAYRWGYFPRTMYYGNNIFEKKNKTEILWCGRMIDWKHPFSAVALAHKLKENEVSFNMNIVGTGEQEDALRSRAKELGLSDCVKFYGEQTNCKVRELMLEAGVFILTSDRQEGWGAVLNEAMGSGCAVIASHAVGSVPYLIKDGKNGFVYRSGNTDMLYEKTRKLLENPDLQYELGVNAMSTIQRLWNESVAADRLIKICEQILSKKDCLNLYSDGPCSRAKKLPDNWY